jgi:hypothetical protein
MPANAAGLVRLFEAHETGTGITGLAMGRKEVAGQPVESDPQTVSFFVTRKLPRRGARRSLEDGRKLLPRRVELEDGVASTDVVLSSGGAPPPEPLRMQRTRFSAGGPVSNNMETGTFGCLVRRPGPDRMFVITNRHVALGRSTVVFFPPGTTPQAVTAMTVDDLDLVSDEAFQPLFDDPSSYFDVDAALVRIPDSKRHLFSSKISRIGIPSAVLSPDFSSLDAYKASLVGKNVSSYSWNSKLRHGVISHVFYVTRRQPHGHVVIYSFLVQGLNNTVPGLARDSGKVWVAKSADGEILLVGLHQGVTSPPGTTSRFAVATEFFSLARLLRIRPYQ